MKAMKILAALALVAVCVLPLAAPAATVTNLGQTITVSLMTETAGNGTQVRATAAPQLVLIDTNANTDATDYTPFDIGQILVGHLTSTATQKVWVAAGPTTNDWVAVGTNP